MKFLQNFICKNRKKKLVFGVLPYPGDWHILENVLPVFIKIYFDAGLKELASEHHRGATLKVLTYSHLKFLM
jgi:hypothetical protein